MHVVLTMSAVDNSECLAVHGPFNSDDEAELWVLENYEWETGECYQIKEVQEP